MLNVDLYLEDLTVLSSPNLFDDLVFVLFDQIISIFFKKSRLLYVLSTLARISRNHNSSLAGLRKHPTTHHGLLLRRIYFSSGLFLFYCYIYFVFLLLLSADLVGPGDTH